MRTMHRRVSWRAVTPFLAVVLGSALLAPAGSLDPPGPPAPTMKPLDVVEPRTPISSLPFVISTAGSYYLTSNLTYTGGNGITVNAGPVTIDLNGFTLDGGGSPAFVGVYVAIPIGPITLRDGTIMGFGAGIDAISASSVLLQDLTVKSCTGSGVQLTDGIITGCTFLSDGLSGIIASGVVIVRDTRSSGSYAGMDLQGSRSLVDDCVLDGNFGWGIRIGSSNGDGILIRDRVMVAENNVYGNTGDGIGTVGEGESRIEGNSLMSNGGYGINSTAGGNFIVRNCGRGNALGNFHITGPGNVAPIETGTITNAVSNVSF
jgi:parallel beta helix pectate lyase-like protein